MACSLFEIKRDLKCIQGLKFPLNFSSVHCTGMHLYLILSNDNLRLSTCSETIAKTILSSYAANFLQIFANLQNNMMSNDGLNIENMDLSHIHLAVKA